MHRVSRLRFIASIGLVAAILAGPIAVFSETSQAYPFSTGPQADVPWTEQAFPMRLFAGATLDRYLDQMRDDFLRLDADGDGKVTQRDANLHALMDAIQVRINAWISVMRYDLDGDGFVSEDEVRRGARYMLRMVRASGGRAGVAEETAGKLVATIMALDTDHDGKVSVAEAGNLVRSGDRPTVRQSGLVVRVRDALTLESASGGELTLAGYEAAAEMLFRKVDTDNDGKISQPELTDYRRKFAPAGAKTDVDAAEAAQKRQREQAAIAGQQAEIARSKQAAVDAERAACPMPTASERAKVVLLSAYQADGVSNATIGSQDNVVHAGRVVVEPGDEPLYVVISSFSPVIWQFSGAVDRVERLVINSSTTSPAGSDPWHPSLAGATGIAPQRVSFLPRSNCLGYFSETPSSASLPAVAAIRSVTGKSPEIVTAADLVSSFSVPSGKAEMPKNERKQLAIQKSARKMAIPEDNSNFIFRAGRGRAAEQMRWTFPGGVVEIDPKTVVASAAVTAYEVLPSQAGLVQLLSAGALAQNNSGEYIVRQKIRFPGGLWGANSATFLVMKGVPYPDGNPGDSCVVVEETGESKGLSCSTR